jgi:hypothetical protein
MKTFILSLKFELVGHDEDLAALDNELHTMLRDALAEFINARFPAESYVMERYAGNPSLCNGKKVAEVKHRMELARATMVALSSATLEPNEQDR